MNKIAGIYKITNNITGEFYVGSSKDIKLRWSIHKTPYTIKRHPNVKLYKAMAQYGRDNFTIEVIEETDNLREREQYWIEYLKPVYNDRHADGIDTERRKEAHKRAHKTYCKNHWNERLAYNKAYYQARRAERLARNKAYYSRLCFYEGKTLTLAALRNRFRRQGIPNPTLRAKSYLIEKRV